MVDQLKGRTGALAAGANQRAARLVPTGAVGAARADARAAVDAIGERLRSGADSAEAVPAAAARSEDRAAVVGDRVLVGPFGMEGVVKALHDRDAEVDVRGKRLRARVDDLRVLAAAAAAPPRRRRGSESTSTCAPRAGSLTELNLIGCSWTKRWRGRRSFWTIR